MSDWMTRAARRTKQALGSSPAPAGTTGGNTAPTPKLPTATPKLQTSSMPSSLSGGLLNSATANFNKLRAIPKPTPAPAASAPQAPAVAAGSQKMRQSFNADPTSYMQQANRSGPLGGFMGAAGLINSDALNTILSGPNIGEKTLGQKAYGLLDFLPGVSGAKMLARPIDNALSHAWDGNWSEAGKQFYDADYNRSMGDSSRSYLDRAGEAMDYGNFYRNATGTAEAVTDSNFWKGLGINMGLLSDNNGARSG